MDQKLLITNVLILKIPGTHKKNRSISAIGGSTSAVVLVHIAPIKQLVSLDLKMAS